MGTKTSVYLSDELTAAWKESGAPLSELIRRGLVSGDAGKAGIEGARLVLLAALDAYGAHQRADTAIPTAHTATPTVTVTPADTAAHTDTAPRTAPKRQQRETAEDAAPPLAATPPKAAACPHRLPKGAWCKVCQASKA